MSVDNGRNGIGRVVESVDEFKAKCDQQRQPKQTIRRVAGDGRGIEIVGYVKDDVDDASGEHRKERKNASFARRALELAVEE